VDILLEGFGDLGRAYREADWEHSPLGPVGSWSPLLRQAVDLTLRTEFPATLLWGPQYALVYNQAYVEMIADKHPAALGRPAQEVFPEAWDVIGPMLDHVRTGKGSTWVEDTYLPLHRRGFLEDCWFTFSYSPVRAVDGTVEGVLDIAAETTRQVVARRRLGLLGELRAALADVEVPADLTDRALPILRGASGDFASVHLTPVGGVGDGAVDAGPAVADDGLVRFSLDGPGRDAGSALAVRLNPMLPRDEEYLAFLDLVAAALRQALDRVAVRAAERQAAELQRSLATALQRSLLPEPPPDGRVQIALRYQPAVELAQVGGDWYDFFELPDGTLTLVIGDVAGHDQRAAAAMAQVRNVLRGVSYTLCPADPSAVLRGVDRVLTRSPERTVATGVVVHARADGGTGISVRWSNAGHPPPVHIDATGAARLLETRPDLLLGLDEEARRSDHDLTLAPGETLVLYTDGLVERRGVVVTKGLEWLVGTLQGRHRDSVEQLCDELLAEADAGGDDVALLVLRA
jgi:serine phosphatase RsbU (regulator of sigma subunit)